MPRIRLKVEYDGTRYVGWQKQPNGPSIQAAIEKAVSTLLKAPVAVSASGRTDAGVHAEGQRVCFDAPSELPLKAYVRGLNRLLPDDIAVVGADEVEAAFDPRRWSWGKRYRYRVDNRPTRSALRRQTHWLYFFPLDVEKMRTASKCLVGRHDFSSFRASDCEAKHAIREVFQIDIQGQAGDEITFTVEGSAFLKHMVRNLVGSLVEVGRGKRSSEWLKEVLEAQNRTLAGPTAPAQGLTLVDVFYKDRPPPRPTEDD